METIIYLVTTLPWPGMGRKDNLENVAKRFVSIFLPAVPASCTMFGGGAWIEDEGCEGEDADFAGKPGSL